jgi:hypothetical protein
MSKPSNNMMISMEVSLGGCQSFHGHAQNISKPGNQTQMCIQNTMCMFTLSCQYIFIPCWVLKVCYPSLSGPPHIQLRLGVVSACDTSTVQTQALQLYYYYSVLGSGLIYSYVAVHEACI